MKGKKLTKTNTRKKGRGTAPLTDPIRQAIIESGMPLLTLAQETGIARASLIRFTRGETSLRLDIADKLAEYFGMRLLPAKTSTNK